MASREDCTSHHGGHRNHSSRCQQSPAFPCIESEGNRNCVSHSDCQQYYHNHRHHHHHHHYLHQQKKHSLRHKRQRTQHLQEALKRRHYHRCPRYLHSHTTFTPFVITDTRVKEFAPLEARVQRWRRVHGRPPLLRTHVMPLSGYPLIRNLLPPDTPNFVFIPMDLEKDDQVAYSPYLDGKLSAEEIGVIVASLRLAWRSTSEHSSCFYTAVNIALPCIGCCITSRMRASKTRQLRGTAVAQRLVEHNKVLVQRGILLQCVRHGVLTGLVVEIMPISVMPDGNQVKNAFWTGPLPNLEQEEWTALGYEYTISVGQRVSDPKHYFSTMAGADQILSKVASMPVAQQVPPLQYTPPSQQNLPAQRTHSYTPSYQYPVTSPSTSQIQYPPTGLPPNTFMSETPMTGRLPVHLAQVVVSQVGAAHPAIHAPSAPTLESNNRLPSFKDDDSNDLTRQLLY